MDLSSKCSVILLIGCGSGVERIDPEDEPLGLASGLLFAGASFVIATIWPTHDRLSGAELSEHSYGIHRDEPFKVVEPINLAGRTISSKQNPQTQSAVLLRWVCLI